LPENTAGVLLINTNPKLWGELSQFELFPRSMSFPGWLYSISGVNFETTIQPWLGDQIGFALLPDLGKNQTRSLTIAAVKESAQVTPLIEQIKQSRKQDPIQHQHNGIAILEWRPVEGSKRPGLAIAVFANHVVTAASIEPIQQLIDGQGQPLSSNPAFQKTMAHPQYSRSLFIGYGIYNEMIKALSAFNRSRKLPSNLPQIPQISPEQLESLSSFYGTVEGYVWADPNGLRFNAGITLKRPIPEALINKMQTRSEILARLPEVNYVVANGQNLELFWRAFNLGFEGDPNFKKPIEQFRQLLQSSLGIDDRDLLPWMNQEVAAFLYPTRQGFLPNIVPNLDLGMGLMVQTSDRPSAEAALQKIEQRFQKVGVAASKTPSVTSFQVPARGQMQSIFSHSWVAPDTLLMLMGGGAVSDFSSPRSLPQSSNFRAAIAPLPSSNLGYFYLNNGATLTLINNGILPLFMSRTGTRSPLLEGFTATLGTIRSISAASSITPGKIQTDAFMSLAVKRPALGQKQPKDPLQDKSKDKQLDQRLDQDKLLDQQSSLRQQQFDYQGALEDISGAIAQHPQTAMYYLQRSDIRLALEDYEGAIADANAALSLENSAVALRNRCYALARGFGEFRAAIADCEQALKLNAPLVLRSRCYVRAKLQDPMALDDCQQALNLEPNDPHTYENRGLAKAALRDRLGAIADFQTAADAFQKLGDAIGQARVEKEIIKIQ
jgi:tetratricopeptide (TPR) repeat protein